MDTLSSWVPFQAEEHACQASQSSLLLAFKIQLWAHVEPSIQWPYQPCSKLNCFEKFFPHLLRSDQVKTKAFEINFPDSSLSFERPAFDETAFTFVITFADRSSSVHN